MALTKVTSGGITDSAITSAKINDGAITNDDIKSDAAITAGKLSATLDLSSKTITLPASSVTAHATTPTKASIEALGIDLPASDLTGTIADARFPSTLPAISGASLTGIDAATVSATAPVSPAAGDMWFNTSGSTVSGVSSNAMATYNGTQWDQMSNKFSATGGTETTYSSGGVTYKVHTFTSSGTFTAGASGTVDVLVVAGGGGGGCFYAGGGGAGGVLPVASKAVTPQAYSIVVGAGGATKTAQGIGNAGSDSTGLGETAVGGGGGGNRANNGAAGGSGGGGGDGYPSWNKVGGAGTAGQGYAGGKTDFANYCGGGGGGGSEVGDDSGPYGDGGDGGDGLASSISGSSVTYAGGGGGCTWGTAPGSPGAGGAGGGGGGGKSDGTAGTANTGGGGGGGGDSGVTYSGGAGGSGIVIIRYAV